ncbi:unnamed protein product [Rangifer tarandus platyrhynchus]|uniref:Uncharacterized protein n=1 Tax=Rangifer tarandus platyrhynchus TaxID=3082113 RepID=A0AC59YP60_RANTA
MSLVWLPWWVGWGCCAVLSPPHPAAVNPSAPGTRPITDRPQGAAALRQPEREGTRVKNIFSELSSLCVGSSFCSCLLLHSHVSGASFPAPSPPRSPCWLQPVPQG